MVGLKQKIILALCTVFLITAALFCVFLLFLPLPSAVGGNGESYLCVWQDGSCSEESYASAYDCLSGADGERILLERGGLTGEISAGKEYARVYSVLKGGSLAELLSLETGALAPLEYAALWRVFGGAIWYSGEAFAWDGSVVARTERETADAVVLLTGTFPSGYLKQTGAETLVLRAEGEFAASDLTGSAVSSVTAEAPYSYADGAVYLTVAGEKRLVAALPCVTALAVEGDVTFADEGALAPCTGIESLEVPFVGSADSVAGTNYIPFFGYLFGTDDEGAYSVPLTLKSVTVTGGKLLSHCFYGCAAIEEIDAGGVLKEDVSKEAFLDCASLLVLRTRAEVSLPFACGRAFDGECYTYTRIN